ncbi:MAG: phage/plasmid primase, P4 family [Desulfuromonadaceae bacterium]|nr:phage/plasmid primase, P4 family [Desulfuromonadaceae bacterium]
MNNLILFNQQFPNSKYRKIHKEVVLPKEFTKEEYANYQRSKAPISTEIFSFEDIKDYDGRVGWIVPEEYVVVDIDNKIDADKIFKLLVGEHIKFTCFITNKGGHFVFKNPDQVKTTAGQINALGIKLDIRSMGTGYIILPHNDSMRAWLPKYLTNDVDDIPKFLYPLKYLNKNNIPDFVTMGEGDGRNNALFTHFKNLQDYANEIELEDKVESIKLINKYLFEKSIPAKELDDTVLRPESIDKPVQQKQTFKITLEQMARKILDSKIMITVNRITYLYNGVYYKKISDSDLELMIHTEYDASLEERHRKELINFLKLKTTKEPDEINNDWHTIVCKNGILDIRDLKLYPHSSSHLSTVYIDHNIKLDAPDGLYSKVMDDFLNHISNGIPEKRTMVLEMIGSCFLQKNVFNKFFLFVGDGSTGKSTLLEIITNLVGEKNTEHLSLSDLDESYKPAELFGKLVNVGDDISFKRIKDASTLKNLVTGNYVNVRQIYGKPFAFKNFAKLIYTANQMPSFSDKTTGLYRRLLIIEMNTPIKNPDVFFMQNLTPEDYEYLFYKSVVAVNAALKRGTGITTYSQLNEDLEEFKQSQSSVIEFLNDELIVAQDLHGVPTKDAYLQYCAWAREAGYQPLLKKHFIDDITSFYPLDKKATTFNGDMQKWRFMLKE